MQDRFKLQVWSVKQNKMYYWSDIIKIHNFGYALFVDNRALGEGIWIKRQSTGLKDKNGKLIYEGDIVKVACMNEKMGGLYYMLMQVIYEVNEHGNDAFSGFSLKHNKKGIFALWGKDKLEVIGNIYENPELLEVEQ